MDVGFSFKYRCDHHHPLSCDNLVAVGPAGPQNLLHRYLGPIPTIISALQLKECQTYPPSQHIRTSEHPPFFMPIPNNDSPHVSSLTSTPKLHCNCISVPMASHVFPHLGPTPWPGQKTGLLHMHCGCTLNLTFFNSTFLHFHETLHKGLKRYRIVTIDVNTIYQVVSAIFSRPFRLSHKDPLDFLSL